MAQQRAPLVRDGSLLLEEAAASQTICIGTPAWYAWLTGVTTFSFESSEGTFTARKERVQRGGEYWKAYRRARGKLLHSYLGKSEDLTLTRLNEVARILARRVESGTGEPTVTDIGAPAQLCRVDWGEASDAGTFYGREKDSAAAILDQPPNACPAPLTEIPALLPARCPLYEPLLFVPETTCRALLLQQHCQRGVDG